ncbi:uncharacterized protein LOC143237541 [Tachypleus tridentatus]|uniref:uncharacterized protein LOC143237541 n=1 Tax=Tachypleus tridentatus TaxID=6853 RepID=UPI003FD074E1
MCFRSLTIILTLLFVTHAYSSRYKRQSTLSAQPDNFEVNVKPFRDDISNQHKSQQLSISQYSPPLSPKIKPEQLLPPGVQYSVETNIQTNLQSTQNQKYRLSYQPLDQYNNPSPYQPPILHQQFDIETQPTLANQHQYLLSTLKQSNYFKSFRPQQGENSQVVYITGQPIVFNAPEQKLSTSQHQSGSQGISFSTTHSSEIIRQEKIGSVQPPVQSVIQKSSASEITFDKGSTAKDKDSNQDQYVIYYYYYYGDDKANNTNPTLNFDDIPNLEAYDQTEKTKQPEKSVKRVNIPQNVIKNDLKVTNSFTTLQPVTTSLEEALVTTLAVVSKKNKTTDFEGTPISNIYRYGNNVPKFPITPNLIDRSSVNQTEKTSKKILDEPKPLSNVNSLTVSHDVGLKGPVSTLLPTSTLSTTVLITESNFEDSNEIIETETEPETTETPTTTTIKATTTTEEPTTTTEKVRRQTLVPRPGFGARKRPLRYGRQPRLSSTAGTATETTTSKETSTKRSRSRFNGRSFPTEKNDEPPTTSSSRARPTSLSRRKSPSSRRLPFLRSRSNRFGHRDEEEQTTSHSSINTNAPETIIATPFPNENPEEKDGDETVDEKQVTTTKESRFSGLFRRRKRPTLFGKRPNFRNR